MNSLKKFAALLLLAPACAVPARSATTYKIEPGSSSVEFKISNFGVHTVKGKFTVFSGEIFDDDADATRSSVSASISVAGIDTGIKGRDAHLQKAEFFAADKFPQIAFQSTSVAKSGAGYVLRGTLTMKGHSQAIELPFTLALDKTPDGKTILRADATGTLKRRDFGIDYGSSFMVGNEVKIILHIRAVPE